MGDLDCPESKGYSDAFPATDVSWQTVNGVGPVTDSLLATCSQNINVSRTGPLHRTPGLSKFPGCKGRRLCLTRSNALDLHSALRAFN
ncbi:hypothetical protein ElyMa_006835700 [Elysia marginata]|uniref:Uncharacterized protein n=1 Tax=Elysia marginata TaxID=1093978 RepID=A0AAV4J6D7_9GAST|nr:hypothetical protein ElyMa_006835700 [Elysia marginata]